MKVLPTTFAAAAAAGAAGLLVFGVASPAVAAGNPIDPGDSMYVITCDRDYPGFQLLSVDASTAVSAPIGVGEGGSSACAAQPAYDPTSGMSYYIRWGVGDPALASIDVVTGVSTVIGDFWISDGSPVSADVYSMAIGADGSAYVTVGDPNTAVDTLWSLDLATAELTNEFTMSTEGLFAFAFDAVTGKFYAITGNPGQDNNMYEVDVTDGTLTLLGALTFTDPVFDYNLVFSLQFDQAGTAWVEADNSDPGGAGLWSFTLATLASPVYSGNFTNDPFYTEALLIIPGEPTLAATGIEAAMVLPIAVGASVLALTGLLSLILVRRRSAESVTD